MKYGMDLTELARELMSRKNDNRVHDYLADTRCMVFDADSNGDMISLNNGSSTTMLTLNGVAREQIGQAFDIPSRYYDRMQKDNPELLAMTINSWFNKEPKRRLVRSLDGTARAFLSDKYRVIDNDQIAEAVLPIISSIPGMVIESCNLTDEKMYIKCVNPRLTAEVTPGDIVQSGIIVSNSEVGRGCLCIQPLVYRLVCKNGMVVNDAATRKYHVGRGNQANEDFSMYTDATIEADTRALIMKVQDTVRSVSEQVRFDNVVEKMRLAKQAEITTHNIPAMVELAGKEFKYTQNEGQSILDYLVRGGDLTMYGMANAVTRAAQDVDSYDRSTVMESIGYNILTMANAKWKQLNAMSAVYAS